MTSFARPAKNASQPSSQPTPPEPPDRQPLSSSPSRARASGAELRGAELRGAPPVTFTFPRAESDLRDWMQGAIDLLTADPARYHLAPEQIAPLVPLVRAFASSLEVAQSPATRSKQATREKNAARDAARAAFKPIVDHIRSHAEIELIAKYELGMNKRTKRTRTPIEPPDSAPLLSIIAAGADGSHTLRYADEKTPTKRRRPKEAGYLDLRVIIAPPEVGIINDPDAAFVLSAASPDGRQPTAMTERITKPIFTVEHDRAHAGWCATYHARWMTNTHKPGRWNHQPVSMIIAFGGPVEPPPEEDHR